MSARIAVVHSEERERLALSTLLRRHGYTALLLAPDVSAEEVWQNEPACVLIQHQPATGDCIKLVRGLRGYPELQHVPLILLTTDDHTEELTQALEDGADLFLAWPHDEAEFVGQLKAQLRIQQRLVDMQRQLTLSSQQLRRLRADLELGQQVQVSFLPSSHLHTQNFSLEARLIAGGDLSGDYFDYRLIAPEHLVLFLADVSGHGVASALLASRLKAMFDSNHGIAKTPVAFMEYLNREIIALGEHYHIATAVAVYIDMQQKIARYASAGHRTMYWLDLEDGGSAQLPATGPALGMFEEFEIGEGTRGLVPGRNRLVAFTDGLVEFRRLDGSWITEQDFCEAVLFPRANLPLNKYVPALIDGSAELAGGGPWEDDVSLFAVDF